MSNPNSFPDLTRKRKDQSIYANFLIQQANTEAGAQPNIHVEYRSEGGAPTQAIYVDILKGRADTTFAEQQAILDNNPPPGQIPGSTALIQIKLIGFVLTVTWSAVPLASYYTVRIYNSIDSEPVDGILVKTERLRVPATQYFVNDLVDGQYYYASVQAEGTGGFGPEVFTGEAVEFYKPPPPVTNVITVQSNQQLLTTWIGPPTAKYYAVEWFTAPGPGISNAFTQLFDRQFPVSNTTSAFTTQATPSNASNYFARVYAYAGPIESQSLPAVSPTIPFWTTPGPITNFIMGDYQLTNSIFTTFTSSVFATNYVLTFYQSDTSAFDFSPSTIFEVQRFSSIRTASQYTNLVSNYLGLIDSKYYFATVVPINNTVSTPFTTALSPFFYRRIKPSTVTGANLGFSIELPPARMYTTWTRPDGTTSSITSRFKITYYQNGLNLGSNLPLDPTTNTVIATNYINADPLTFTYTDVTNPVFLSSAIYYYSLVESLNQDVEGGVASTPLQLYLAMPSSPSARITQFGSQIAANFTQVPNATSYIVQFYQNTRSTLITDQRYFFGGIQTAQSTNSRFLTVVAPSTPTDSIFYYATVIAVNSNVQGIESAPQQFIRYSVIPGAPITNLYYDFLPGSTDPIIVGEFTMLSNATTYEVKFFSNANGNTNPFLSGLVFASNVTQVSPNTLYTVTSPSTVSNASYTFMTVQAFNGSNAASNTATTVAIPFYRKPSTVTGLQLTIIDNVSPAYLRVLYNIITPEPGEDVTITGYNITLYDNGYSQLPVITNTIFQQSTLNGQIPVFISSNDLIDKKYYWAAVRVANNTTLGDPVTVPVQQYLLKPGQPEATITYGYTYCNGLQSLTETLTAGWFNLDPATTGISTTFYSESPSGVVSNLFRISSRPVPTFASLNPGTIQFSNLFNYYAIVTPYNQTQIGFAARTQNFTYYAPPSAPGNLGIQLGPDQNTMVGTWVPRFPGADFTTGYKLELWLSTTFDLLVKSYSVDSPYTDTTYTFDAPLQNLAFYYFKLQAFNTIENSISPQVTSSNRIPFYQVPSSVEGAQILLINFSTLLVTWNAPTTFKTSYTVNIYQTSNGLVSTPQTAALIASYPGITSNATSVPLYPTLLNSSNYFAQIFTLNNTAQSPAALTQNTVQYYTPPAPISNFTISTVNVSTLVTTWSTAALASTYTIDYWASTSNVSSGAFSFIDRSFSNLTSSIHFYSTSGPLTAGYFYYAQGRGFNNVVSSIAIFTRNNVQIQGNVDPASNVQLSVTGESTINITWAYNNPPSSNDYTNFFVDFYSNPPTASNISSGGTFVSSMNIDRVNRAAINGGLPLSNNTFYYATVTVFNLLVASPIATSRTAFSFLARPGPIPFQQVQIVRPDLNSQDQFARVIFSNAVNADRYQINFYMNSANTSTTTSGVVALGPSCNISSTSALNDITYSFPITNVVTGGFNGRYYYTMIIPYNGDSIPGDLNYPQNNARFWIAPSTPSVTLQQISNVAGAKAFSTIWAINGTWPITSWSTFFYEVIFGTGSLLESAGGLPSNQSRISTTSLLQNASQYYSQVIAYNNGVPGLLSTSATTQFWNIPTNPLIVTLQQLNSNGLTASWTPAGDINDITSYFIQVFSVGTTTTVGPNFPGVPLFTSTLDGSQTSLLLSNTTIQNRVRYTYYIRAQNNTIALPTYSFVQTTVPFLGTPTPPSSIQIFVNGNTLAVSFFTPTDYTSSFPASYSVTIFDNGSNPVIQPGATVFETRNFFAITPPSATNTQYTFIGTNLGITGNYYYATAEFQNINVSSSQLFIASSLTTVQYVQPPDPPRLGRIFQTTGPDFSSVFVRFSTPTTNNPAFNSNYQIRIFNNPTSVPSATPTGLALVSSASINSPQIFDFSATFSTVFQDKAYYTAYGYSIGGTGLNSVAAVTSTTTNVAFQYLGTPGAPINVANQFVQGTPDQTRTIFSTPADNTSSFATQFDIYLWDNGTNSTYDPGATLVRSNMNFVNTASATSRGYAVTWNLVLTNQRYYYTVIVPKNSNAYNVVIGVSTVGPLAQYFQAPTGPSNLVLSQSNSTFIFSFSTPQTILTQTASTFTLRFYNNAGDSVNYSYTSLWSTFVFPVGDPMQSTFSGEFISSYFTNNNYYFVDGFTTLSNTGTGPTISTFGTYPRTTLTPYRGIPGDILQANATSFLSSVGGINYIAAQFSTATDFTSSFATFYNIVFYDNGLTSNINTLTAVPIGSTLVNDVDQSASRTYGGFLNQALSNGRFYYAAIQAFNLTFSSPSIVSTLNTTRFLGVSQGLSQGNIVQSNSTFFVTYTTPSDGTEITATGYFIRLYSTTVNAFISTPASQSVVLAFSTFIPNTFSNTITISTIFSSPQIQFPNSNIFFAGGTVVQSNESAIKPTNNAARYFTIPSPTLSNAIIFSTGISTLVTSFSSPADFTSSVVTNYMVTYWSNANNDPWPTNYSVYYSTLVAGALASASRAYCNIFASNSPTQGYYFATITPFNNSIVGLSSVTATNAQYFWAPGIVTNTVFSTQASTFYSAWSAPTQIYSTSQLTFNVRLYQSNVNGFSVVIPAATHVPIQTAVQTTTQSNENYSIVWSSPTNQFSNAQWFATYIQTVNNNLLSSSWVLATTSLQYYQLPGAPVNVSTFVNTTSNVVIYWSSPTDYTSSLVGGYIVSLFGNGLCNTLPPTNPTLLASTVVANVANATSRGFSNLMGYTIPAQCNASYFFGVVQMSNTNITFSPFSTTSGNLAPFFTVLGQPRNASMTLSLGFSVQWSTPTDSTSSFVSSYRVVLYNNGTGSNLPAPYIPNSNSIISTFFVAAVPGQMCNIYSVGGSYLTVNNYYYATVQAMQSNTLTTFSSIVVSTTNTGQYLVPPSPLSSLYMVNNSYMYYNWFSPADNSIVTHVNVQIFSNATGTLDYNATPFCNTWCSTNSFCPLVMPTPGTFYYFGAVPYNGLLGGALCSTTSAKLYNLLATSHYLGTPARNNRYPVAGPGSNAVVRRAVNVAVNGVTFPTQGTGGCNFYGGNPYIIGNNNTLNQPTVMFKSQGQASRQWQIYNEGSNTLTSIAFPGQDVNVGYSQGCSTDELGNIYMLAINNATQETNYFQYSPSSNQTWTYGLTNIIRASAGQQEFGLFTLIGGDGYHYIPNPFYGSPPAVSFPSVSNATAFLVLSNPNTINNGSYYAVKHTSSAFYTSGSAIREMVGPLIWSPQGLVIVRYECSYGIATVNPNSNPQAGNLVVAYRPNHRTRPDDCALWRQYLPSIGSNNVYSLGHPQMQNRLSGTLATQFFIICSGIRGDSGYNAASPPGNRAIVIFGLNGLTGEHIWNTEALNNRINQLITANVNPYGNQNKIMNNLSLLNDDTVVFVYPGDPRYIDAPQWRGEIYLMNAATGLLCNTNDSTTPTWYYHLGLLGRNGDQRSYGWNIGPAVDRNNRIYITSYNTSNHSIGSSRGVALSILDGNNFGSPTAAFILSTFISSVPGGSNLLNTQGFLNNDQWNMYNTLDQFSTLHIPGAYNGISYVSIR